MSAPHSRAPARRRTTGQPGKVASGEVQFDASLTAGLPARMAASAIIDKVIDKRASLDSLCEDKSGLAGWRALDGRDRYLARAIATVALRNRVRIAAILERLSDRGLPKNARHLHNHLHVAAAQILFMEVPESAAVNLAVTAIAGDQRTAKFAGFANAMMRKLAATRIRQLENLRTRTPAAADILPTWLAQALERDHGADAAGKIAVMLAREPELHLVANPAADPMAVAADMAQLGATEIFPGVWRVKSADPVPSLPGYSEGRWWVQDVAAALPARLLGDVAGKDVADLCAAPGGKTVQLCAAGARVTAVDLSKGRLVRVSENLARMGLEAEIVCADVANWDGGGRLFDAILLDAPCSATGTIRRHPDIAWNKTPEDIEKLVKVQARLIEAAAALLKPGGVLVYANCSLLKAEGEALTQRLVIDGLERWPFRAGEAGLSAQWLNDTGELRTLPHFLGGDESGDGGMDGFFAARWRRSA